MCAADRGCCVRFTFVVDGNLQGDHQGRLLTNVVWTDGDFAPIAYDAALDLAARRMTGIQSV